MLYYDKIDLSEGIGVNKRIASKKGNISHYCYFLNYSFKFKPNFCNFFWWKSYKYFIGYLYDNHKFKPLQIKQEAAF